MSKDWRKDLEADSTDHSAEFQVDLRDPKSWQLKIRAFLENVDSIQTAERYVEECRIFTTLAGRIVRDRVYARVTKNCFVCGKALKPGQPGGDAGYYDATREWIKVYCCSPHEFQKLLEMVAQKQTAIEEQGRRADKLAREASIKARQAAS